MVQLFKYVRGTKYIILILNTDRILMLKWYIDGSYALHHNRRGRIGVGLTMGKGLPIYELTKKKLNTRSSTKLEIVGVGQLITLFLWTRIF